MIHESKLYGDQFCLPKTTEYKYDPGIVKQFFAQEHLALTHRQQKCAFLIQTQKEHSFEETGC